MTILNSKSVTKNKVTIADVGRLAGCSKGVVSAVVNNARGNISVSEQLRERVMNAAAQLGYRPNFASQSLARKTTQTIGIYVAPREGASMGFPYESRILRGIEMACRDRDYDLLVLNLGGNMTPEQCLSRFAERRMDGVMIVHVDHDASWVAPLVTHNHNVVSVNYYGDQPMLANVIFDDRKAASRAVQHLVELGHQRIGYLGGVAADHGPGGALRLAGYRQGMAEAKLPVQYELIFDVRNPMFDQHLNEIGWSWEDGPNGAEYFMALGDACPTALVCYGDTLCLRAMHYLQAKGYRVPDDISLIGIGDEETSRIANPSLSSIRMPLEDMSAYATNALIDNVQRGNGSTPSERLLWPPKLIARGSTAPPR